MTRQYLDPLHDELDRLRALEIDHAALTDRLESAEARIDSLLTQRDDYAAAWEAARDASDMHRATATHLTNANADLTRELATLRAERDEERAFHRLRSDALNRTGADNDRLRAKIARVEALARYLDTLADGDRHYAQLIRTAITHGN